MKCLVTGASGFVGSFVVDELLRNGFDVVGTYRTAMSNCCGKSKCQIIQVDLTRGFNFPNNVDVIVHTAAQTMTPNASVIDYAKNNILTMKNVVDYAIQTKVKKIINFSSISIYGTIQDPIVNENTKIMNPSAYGITKYLAELILQEIGSMVPSLSLRLPGIVPKMSEELWLSKVCNKVYNNENIEIYNPNSQFNNAIYIRDLCKFIISLINMDFVGADAITLGCASPLTINDVVQYIISNCDSTASISVNQEKKNSFLISNDKATRKYGYVPAPLKDILEHLVNELTLNKKGV